MAKYANRKAVEVNIAEPQQSHVPIYDQSTGLWSTIDLYDAISEQTGSSNIAGNLVVTGSVSSLGGFTGSFTGSFTGYHTGDGSDLIFTKISTSQSSDSVLVIGNEFNDYEYQQTTIFKNNNVVVSGSLTVSEDGVLILFPREAPNPPISGGVFYSSSGEFYVGT